MTQKALIYCRVSDTKQKNEGSGLESQEHRCRQFAQTNNLSVEKIFHDDVTGGGDFKKRPAMSELLEYVKTNKDTQYILILDDIKRISRDVYFYWDLIRRLDEFGVQPMSPNFIFANTPEGRFQQSITVAAGEYERETIARQTKQKTKARLEAGFHAFNAPVGYEFIKAKEGGKILVKKEPAASALSEMMEGFASGRFQTKNEARDFLEASPAFPKGKSGKIGNSQIDKILKDPLYAGYIQYLPWGVSLRKGKHKGMVDLETFKKIQERLEGRAHAPARKGINEDFPLRNAIACECGNSLTSGWSKSATGKYYGYYLCQNRKCRFKGKSIRKDVLEAEFEKILENLTPSQALFFSADTMFKNMWNQLGANLEDQRQQLKYKLNDCDENINIALNRLVESKSSNVASAFEKRIESLEQEKLLVEERIAKCGTPLGAYDKMYRTSLNFLSNPHKLWVHGGYAGKRIVLKLTFIERLTWDRKGMYRTPKLSAPFRVLNDLKKPPACSADKGFRDDLSLDDFSSNEGTFDPQLSQFLQMVPGAGLEPARHY